ncbi:MAG: hypothetical protein KKD44_07920 [Proteobacteria bacterium]|nr:hypothetical protein [Pseudomonadota bacterium]
MSVDNASIDLTKTAFEKKKEYLVILLKKNEAVIKKSITNEVEGLDIEPTSVSGTGGTPSVTEINIEPLFQEIIEKDDSTTIEINSKISFELSVEYNDDGTDRTINETLSTSVNLLFTLSFEISEQGFILKGLSLNDELNKLSIYSSEIVADIEFEIFYTA